jgi:DNA-binding transcriptional LysR family regulator
VKLRQLEVFRAIYLAGSITAAAKTLHVTAPAISRMLGLLEQQLKYLLFQRTATGLTPTFEAQQLFRSTKPLFAQLNQLQSLSESLQTGAGRHLRIGSSSSASLSMVPNAMALLMEKNPALSLSLDVLQTDNLIDQLLSLDIDAGVSTVNIEHPDILVEILFETSLVCAFKKGHPLAEFSELSLDQVAQYSVINFHSTAPQILLIREAMSDIAPCSLRSITARFSSAALALVIATNHVTLIDEVAARDYHHPDIRFRAITGFPKFQITLVSLRENPNANLVIQFRQALQRVLTKH